MNTDIVLNKIFDVLHSMSKDPFIKGNDKCSGLLKIINESLANLETCSENLQDPRILNSKAITILKMIEEQVYENTLFLGAHKVKSLQAKLKKAHEFFAIPSLTDVRERPITPIIDMKLAFICDIDGADANGSMLPSIRNLIISRIPFITTRSVLCGSNNVKKKLEPVLEIEKLLSNKSAEWTIFQENSEQSREFLVFIPKSSTGEKEAADLLKSLDFKDDGTLKRISSREALVPPRTKALLGSFLNLFVENPKNSKLIFIGGHGGVGQPAGLSKENYPIFLQFLNKQNCRGAIIFSCYAGGESTLIHIKHPFKFPIIMRSIGDFPTLSNQKAEADFFAHFSE